MKCMKCLKEIEKGQAVIKLEISIHKFDGKKLIEKVGKIQDNFCSITCLKNWISK